MALFLAIENCNGLAFVLQDFSNFCIRIRFRELLGRLLSFPLRSDEVPIEFFDLDLKVTMEKLSFDSRIIESLNP